MSDKFKYPFSNVNDATVEVWEFISISQKVVFKLKILIATFASCMRCFRIGVKFCYISFVRLVPVVI